MKYVSLISGWTVRQAKSILHLIQGPLSFWLKNTGQELVLAVLRFEYRDKAVSAMYAIRKRWEMLLNRFPARRKMHEWQMAYHYLYDEWLKLDEDYKNLYAKYLDLSDEVRYWETRHAKVLNYIEKKMEGESD